MYNLSSNFLIIHYIYTSKLNKFFIYRKKKKKTTKGKNEQITIYEGIKLKTYEIILLIRMQLFIKVGI